jgi:hypothetical protein
LSSQLVSRRQEGQRLNIDSSRLKFEDRQQERQSYKILRECRKRAAHQRIHHEETKGTKKDPKTFVPFVSSWWILIFSGRRRW